MPKGSTKLFPIITFELFNHYLLTTGETQNITKVIIVLSCFSIIYILYGIKFDFLVMS